MTQELITLIRKTEKEKVNLKRLQRARTVKLSTGKEEKSCLTLFLNIAAIN